MITCWGNNVLSEVRSAPLEPGANVDGTRIKHYTNVSVVALARHPRRWAATLFYGLEGSPSNLFEVSRSTPTIRTRSRLG